jgi:hypothetical protein
MEHTHNTIHSHTTVPVTVKMYTREAEVEKRLLRGRVLLDSDDQTLLFAQNEPRTKFSKEIFRSDHGRLVRRWDGLYTFTFSKVDATERRLRETLLAELRNAADAIDKDQKKLEKERKAVEAERQKAEKEDTSE